MGAFSVRQRVLALLVFGIVGFGLLAAPLADAFSDGQAASLVLGHATFTTDGRATAQRLAGPSQIAIDPVSGSVFVADTANHRVLRFGSQAALANHAAAEGVLGQSSFTSNRWGSVARSMHLPSGVAVDSSGRLWVADTGNNRVLRFDNAARKPNGAPADDLLGQPDFGRSTAQTGAQGMAGPRAVAVDGHGRLWVADADNSRVLRFDGAGGKGKGAAADGVLGQIDFAGSTPTSGARRIQAPHGLALDEEGHLWVADESINRVLRFHGAAAKSNGAPADGVLGQPDFASTAASSSTAGMRRPAGLALDGEGRLWVADTLNSRMLRFDSAAAKPNGAPADGALGQGQSLPGAGWVSADRMSYPVGVAVDRQGRLWVADSSNNRVLRFDSAAAKPNHAPADGLLGNDRFTTRRYVAADVLAAPVAVAVDPTTGKVFVADELNNRVLRFASRAVLRSGAAAEGVLGQPDFVSDTGRRGDARGMDAPASVALDTEGRLWVVDSGSNRVLRFDNAAGLPDGAPADGVLGQPNFVGFDPEASAEGMDTPRGVVVDGSGRLWVADSGNNRVLRFDNAAGLPNGAPADGVLGQPDFLRKEPGISAFALRLPNVLALDTEGRLWVADGGNNRVLRFDSAAGLSDGPPADGVLGQIDFTSSRDSAGPFGIRSLNGLAVDGSGRLWVSDTGNHRVLRFDSAAGLPNGSPADGVLGQPDLFMTHPATSAAGLWFPAGLAMDGDGSFWVADEGNNRMLLFEDRTPGTGQRVYLPLVRRAE